MTNSECLLYVPVWALKIRRITEGKAPVLQYGRDTGEFLWNLCHISKVENLLGIKPNAEFKNLVVIFQKGSIVFNGRAQGDSFR